MIKQSNSQREINHLSNNSIQIIENQQKDQFNIQQQVRKKSIALIPDIEKSDNIDARVDFIQDQSTKRSTLRILNEADMQLSPKYVSFSQQISDNQVNISQQNFSKAVQNMKIGQNNLVEKQKKMKQNFIKKKMANFSSQDEFTPYHRHIDQDFNQNNIDQRQVFEELDEWKHEVDNIKMIQNYTHQLLNQQSSKSQKKNFYSIPSRDSIKEQDNMLNQNYTQDTAQSRKSLIEDDEQNNTSELVKQMIAMHNNFKKEEEASNPSSYISKNDNEKNKFQNSLTNKAINYEPRINEMILNSIINNDELIANNKDNKRKYSNNTHSPINSPRHLISNGASPQMNKNYKSKFMKYHEENSDSKQSTPNQKAVTFKDITKQNQQDASVSSQQKDQQVIPKKTVKQIQSETNEMLIEKLFLMKLKKKIEPLHQEQINHLKHRFLNKLKEVKNETNVDTQKGSEQSQVNPSRQKSLFSNNHKQNQEVATQNKTHAKGFSLQLQDIDSQSISRQSLEKYNPGFLSQREQKNLNSHNSIGNIILQKQQDIVKDEIENFQKNTLESFKFIQEMKRQRTGTPQLMNLVSGRKVGELDNQSKTEKYIKYLEKEFSLNSVKQSVQITKQWADEKQPNQINDQALQKLQNTYQSTLSKITESKDQLETCRLESFRLSSIINQIQEEKKKIHERMQAELEKSALQKYSMLNLSNVENSNQGNLRSKQRQKQQSQQSLGHISSLIFEQQENIRLDYETRQRSLSKKIAKIKQDIQDNTQQTLSITEQLQNLKNVKISTKKQLKDYYLSLLQQNKGNENPQISITALIQYMQGIGEEVNEKMLPSYFDQHNIAFVKKLQELTFQLEKLQEEQQIVQRSTKNSLHSQIQLNKFQSSQNELKSSPEFLPSSNILNLTKRQQKNEQQTQNTLRNNQFQSNPIQNSLGVFSNSMISQPFSNRNWEDEDKKLLQMMLGNELNHKKEIKKKLSQISKNTLQTKAQSSQNASVFQSLNQIEGDEIQVEQNTQDKLRIDLKIMNEKQQQEKNDDENYFFLYNLKRGSLSVLDYHKKIFEHSENIQNQILRLKEQELERIIKQYHSINVEDRIQNVKKIFILMYGNQEGNIWFSKFMKRRKDIQLKSHANKTFNFQEVLFSKFSAEQSAIGGIQKEEINQLKANQSKQQSQNGNSNKLSNNFVSIKQQQNNLKIKEERTKVKRNFKRLQDESDNQKFNYTTNDIFFRDPFSIISKQQQQQQKVNNPEIQGQEKRIDQQIIQDNFPDKILNKYSKSVHFSSMITEKQNLQMQFNQSQQSQQLFSSHRKYPSTQYLPQYNLDINQ